MKTESKATIQETVRRIEMTQRAIIILIIAIFAAIMIFSVLTQLFAEKDAFSLVTGVNPKDSIANKNQYEVYKLAAEIRQIRSDTSGSLFWLKLVGLFVTVGGAVGGYLFSQERVNKNRLNFEQRKNIDTTYQSIVQELSSSEAVLRATAAVKLGAIINNFPEEWNTSGDEKKNAARKEELVLLTKNVLAAALSIEKNEKVLKTITIALVPKTKSAPQPGQTIADLSYLDLSSATAHDAFWAYADFSNSDFFGAKLANASLRSCNLYGTSFYKADLNKTVLRLADCRQSYFTYAKLQGANFKNANLRGANFDQAIFDEQTNFEGAKVFGMSVKDTDTKIITDVQVDISKNDGDAPEMVSIQEWFSK